MGPQHMHEAGGVSEPSGRQLDLEEAFYLFIFLILFYF